MRISIVVDRGKERVVIPISKMEVHDWYDFIYLVDDGFYKDLELNNMDKGWVSYCKKISILLDCVNDGGCGGIKFGKDKKMRFVKTDMKFWHSGKRPNWKRVK